MIVFRTAGLAKRCHTNNELAMHFVLELVTGTRHVFIDVRWPKQNKTETFFADRMWNEYCCSGTANNSESNANCVTYAFDFVTHTHVFFSGIYFHRNFVVCLFSVLWRSWGNFLVYVENKIRHMQIIWFAVCLTKSDQTKNICKSHRFRVQLYTNFRNAVLSLIKSTRNPKCNKRGLNFGDKLNFWEITQLNYCPTKKA